MRHPNATYKRGAAAVEFAIVAPVFILLIMGMIELSRGLMVQQLLINATREGARHACLPEATTESVKSVVRDYLSGVSINLSADNISVSPDPGTTFNNEQITVAASVDVAQVSWTLGKYITGTLDASTKMRSERFE